jgi:hypothetical protein
VRKEAGRVGGGLEGLGSSFSWGLYGVGVGMERKWKVSDGKDGKDGVSALSTPPYQSSKGARKPVTVGQEILSRIISIIT